MRYQRVQAQVWTITVTRKFAAIGFHSFARLDTECLGGGLCDPASSAEPVLARHMVFGGSSGLNLIVEILSRSLFTMTVFLFFLGGIFLFLGGCFGLLVALGCRAGVIGVVRPGGGLG